MSKSRLAVAVLTFNEERDLPKNLKSLENLGADIFVFDSFSSDLTPKIASDHGAELIYFKWNGKYPKKKQWAVDYLKEKYDWVLLLDADEEISELLAEEIIQRTNANLGYFAYDVNLHYWFGGKRLRHGLKFKKRILFQPQKINFPILNDLSVSNMWEVEGHYQPLVLENRVGNLSNPLNHHDTGDLYSFFGRHNRYSDWESFMLSKPELKKSLLQVRPKRFSLFMNFPFKGPIIFLYSFFIKRGFLDGIEGFDFAINQAFYHWQVKAKIRNQGNN
jgi:hypothetical protein